MTEHNLAAPTCEQGREPRGYFAERLPEGSEEFASAYRLERMVKEARRAMGEERWAQLQREWGE